MKNEFAGKTALVTGASRGIGAATALALARHGAARVVVHYNSYKEGAQRVLEEVRTAGVSADAIQADLSRMSGIESFLSALEKKAPEVDILVNNAGSLVKRAPLAGCPGELYDRVMDLNVKSVWMITQAVVPYMKSAGGGIIVNLSSIAARTGGGAGATVYAAAKGAVAAMTRGLARSLAQIGRASCRERV